MYLKYQMMMVIIIVITLRKSNKVCNALYEKKKIHCSVIYGKMREREKEPNGPKYGISCKYSVPGLTHFCLEHKI